MILAGALCRGFSLQDPALSGNHGNFEGRLRWERGRLFFMSYGGLGCLALPGVVGWPRPNRSFRMVLGLRSWFFRIGRLVVGLVIVWVWS